MVYSIKDKVREEANPRRWTGSSKYLDGLKNVSLGNIKHIEDLISQVEDTESNYYGDITHYGNEPKEVKALLQKTYDRLKLESYKPFYDLRYDKNQTFGDVVDGNPVTWAKENIQKLYDEFLSGNPSALLSGLLIVARRTSSSDGKNRSVRTELRKLVKTIKPNDSEWQSLDKTPYEDQIIETTSLNVNFLDLMDEIHTQTHRTINKEYLKSELQTTNFPKIMAIFHHLLKRTDTNFNGPLAQFYIGGDSQVKNSLIKKLFTAQGETAVETLFNNYLTFITSQRSTKGAGDIRSNKNKQDWVTEFVKKRLENDRMSYDESDEDYNIILIPAEGGVGEVVETRKKGIVTTDITAKNNARDYFVKRSNLEDSDEYADWVRWKNAKAPAFEGEAENRTAYAIDMTDSETLLNNNRYVKMLAIYHRDLISNNNADEIASIPNTHNFVYLDEEASSSFVIKGRQFKNMLALLKPFNPEGISDILSVLQEFEKLSENATEYFNELKSNIEPYEKKIRQGIRKLFAPVENIIVQEIYDVLNTLNPKRIKAQGNYIIVTNSRKQGRSMSYNPYEYLEAIGILNREE